MWSEKGLLNHVLAVKDPFAKCDRHVDVKWRTLVIMWCVCQQGQFVEFQKSTFQTNKPFWSVRTSPTRVCWCAGAPVTQSDPTSRLSDTGPNFPQKGSRFEALRMWARTVVSDAVILQKFWCRIKQALRTCFAKRMYEGQILALSPWTHTIVMCTFPIEMQTRPSVRYPRWQTISSLIIFETVDSQVRLIILVADGHLWLGHVKAPNSTAPDWRHTYSAWCQSIRTSLFDRDANANEVSWECLRTRSRTLRSCEFHSEELPSTPAATNRWLWNEAIALQRLPPRENTDATAAMNVWDDESWRTDEIASAFCLFVSVTRRFIHRETFAKVCSAIDIWPGAQKRSKPCSWTQEIASLREIHRNDLRSVPSRLEHSRKLLRHSGRVMCFCLNFRTFEFWHTQTFVRWGWNQVYNFRGRTKEFFASAHTAIGQEKSFDELEKKMREGDCDNDEAASFRMW